MRIFSSGDYGHLASAVEIEIEGIKHDHRRNPADTQLSAGFYYARPCNKPGVAWARITDTHMKGKELQ
jgi:hypothetical protein